MFKIAKHRFQTFTSDDVGMLKLKAERGDEVNMGSFLQELKWVCSLL